VISFRSPSLAAARRVSINTLIEKPKTLRWRSVVAMMRVLTLRVDLNSLLHPGNMVALESTLNSNSLRTTLRLIAAGRNAIANRRLRFVEQI
jgi:hypothetical protein